MAQFPTVFKMMQCRYKLRLLRISLTDGLLGQLWLLPNKDTNFSITAICRLAIVQSPTIVVMRGTYLVVD